MHGPLEPPRIQENEKSGDDVRCTCRSDYASAGAPAYPASLMSGPEQEEGTHPTLLPTARQRRGPQFGAGDSFELETGS